MRRILLASAIAMVAAPMANAACTQPDTKGTWASYTVGLNVTNDYWTYCVLKIDATGQFSATTSSCTASTGLKSPAQGAVHLINGNLCSFDGGIELTKGTPETFIRHMTLAYDKHTAEGVGAFEGDGVTISFVRIK